MKHIIKENGLATENNLALMLNDFSIDAIIAIDNEHNVIAWNQTAADMHGISKEAAMGHSIFQLIAGLEDDADTIKAIEQAFKGYNCFVPASKLQAHRRHSENHYIPLKNNASEVVGVMNIVHDVAHRIKAEQQLQQLNEELQIRIRQLQIASDEMASFTYITSNKIKEPIRHVYTGVEFLIKSEAARLSDSGKASFRRIQSSLNRMDLLLDDILKLSQISILQKAETSVDLTELVNQVADEIKQKTDHEVSFVINALCVIPGHKEYLHLLFYHLLDNAIKFNHADVPEIKVDCEKVLLNEESVVVSSMNEFYKLSIMDNGIGFKQEDAKKIFAMFEKLHDRQYKGSGIGLAVAQKIMHAHNGFITAESNGHGSAFHCFFPV